MSSGATTPNAPSIQSPYGKTVSPIAGTTPYNIGPQAGQATAFAQNIPATIPKLPAQLPQVQNQAPDFSAIQQFLQGMQIGRPMMQAPLAQTTSSQLPASQTPMAPPMQQGIGSLNGAGGAGQRSAVNFGFGSSVNPNIRAD